MNRKEFFEMVDFGLALNAWAASQPGYKPPVTDADVEAVMAKVRPQLKTAAAEAKLKYSVLVQIINKEKPKAKVPFSVEVSVVKKRVESELLKLKLVDIVEGELKASESGRRWTEDYERAQAELSPQQIKEK